MNPETENLIERPYQEVIDDILVALVGGIVNEPIIFDLKTVLYPLAQPASGIRGVTGTITIEEDGINREIHYSFLKDIDFEFNADQNAVVWVEGGKQPKDETIFYVDYFLPETDSPLTDINVGSVTRTISEAIGREIATVYEQINRAYLSGFIDTAEGTALDLVVAILGIKRLTADFAIGLETFFRDPAITGNITIPAGILLATAKSEVTFVTTQTRTLQRGQARIDVPFRAADEFPGEDGKVEAGTITELAQTIAGIANISNFEATFLGAENESDVELRIRAKAALRSLGNATLAALARVIFEQRAGLLEVWDPNSPPANRSTPGTTVLLVESEPERFPSLRGAVEETRAAGVHTNLIARYNFFTPHLVVQMTKGLPSAGQLKVKQQIIAAIQAYIDGLGSGEPAEGQEMLKAAKEVDDVTEVRFIEILAWNTDLEKTTPETLSESLVNVVTESGVDNKQRLQDEILKLLTVLPPLLPTGRRIPNRSIIQGTGDAAAQAATDEQIESGDFQISATLNNENWFVALDMDPDDILIEEKEG